MGDLAEYAKQVLADRASGTVEPRGPIDLALDETAEAMRREGIVKGEPAWPLMQACSTMLAAVGGITEQHTAAMKALLAEAKAQSDAEIERLKVAAQAAEAEAIGRIAASIAGEAKKALAKRVQLDQRKFIVGVLGGAIVAVIVLGVGAYQWGRATRDGELIALANGIKVTGTTAELLRDNDFDLALAQPMQHGVQQGRRWVAVPVWLDPPPPAQAR
jgi:hypothetical protein